jgi:transcriptional regulator with AAA-type ATPase domain
MQQRIALFRGPHSLGEWELADDPLELGSSALADIHVDEPALPARAYLIQAQGGTVWLYDLARAELKPRVLPLDGGLPLPGGHRLLRVQRDTAPHVAGRVAQTSRLDRSELCSEGWVISVGRGPDARRITVRGGPLRVGSGSENDLVLHDPTVSSRHCRFEPGAGQLCVRDLGSTNGTYVQGLRVTRVELPTGARVRVGRTDLHIYARTSSTEHVRFVAASGAMQQVLLEAQQFAPLPWPLLLLGPSGSGKEELAALLHRSGPRKHAPFVALNAGGLPRELIESELFGHERGAFTGAVAQRRGVFEQAHGGTIFLDEIGELPLDLQARLLRVLETWQVRRVGAESSVAVDVRLLCATHRDLLRMVAAGTFREDLYFRLARLVLHIPPLSERGEDILPLARHFLAGVADDVGVRALGEDAEARLLAHDWPGNARELRNVLSSAAALSPGKVLSARDIDQAIARLGGRSQLALPSPAAVSRAVERCGGNVTAAARMLELPRSTLRDHLKRAPDDEAADRPQSRPRRTMSSSSSPK